MKIGIVISTNESETVWNVFRLANFSLTKDDSVKIFLLGQGVEAEKISNEKFDVKKQMENFVSGGGEILACGTCLKSRNETGSDMCPVSTMADLYQIIAESEKVLSF